MIFKGLIFFTLQSFLLFTVHAGAGKIDSVIHQLPAERDTNRVNALNELCFLLKRTDPEGAINYAREAIQLSKELEDLPGLAVAYNNLGGSFYYLNNYPESLKWHSKAAEIHKQINNITGYRFTLNDIGLIYHKQNNYPKALEYYLKSLNISEQQGDELLISSSLNNIGNLYAEQENYEKALLYYNRSLEIHRRVFKKGRKVSQLLNNIGDIYLRESQYEKALPYFMSALEGLTQEDKDQESIVLANIGMTYGGVRGGGLKDYSKALEYLSNSLTLQKQLGDRYMIPYVLTGLSYVFHHTTNFIKSKQYAERAIKLAQELEIKSLVAELYLLLSEIAEKQGDFRKAYNYHKHYVTIQESIKSDDNIRRITQLQSNYEIEKKQTEIELLRKDQQQEALVKKTLIAGLVAFLIVSSLLLWMQRLKSRKNKLLQEKSREVEEKNKELEAQAKVLEQQAEELEIQTERLKELDQVKTNFFANISHEFRTPLTLIMSNLDEKLLEYQKANPKENLYIERKEVDMMFRNANRLLQLINQLLDLSKLESGKMRLFLKRGDLTPFVDGILASFESLADSKNVVFKYRLPSTLLTCYFDSDKVETILYNLLSNAFKFTPEGGEITFEMAQEISTNVVRITITDSGPGIPENEMGRIFERFYQVDSTSRREFEGTGIGLSLTKELIVLMDGKINVQSKAGFGTTFSIVLPISEKLYEFNDLEEVEGMGYQLVHATDNMPDNDENGTLLKEHASVNTILLVEDSDDLRVYLKNILEKKYNVIQAGNGLEALELAKENIPDLILSDMMMPKMDGFSLCEEIRKNELTSHVPFVLLTARASVESRLQGLELGADDYLTKPFNIKELQIRIRNLLDQRKSLREKFGKEIKVAARDVTVTSLDEKFLNRAMEVVEENISNTDFSVEKFSEEMAMSRKNLHRKMVALIDQGPNEFIRNFRLARAKQLLEQNSGNIGEIAYATGFSNLSYFTKCFKEHFGVLPTEMKSMKSL